MKKVMFQLFRTPNAAYLYDANKDELLPISVESYEYLYHYVREEALPPVPEEVLQLQANGYLADSVVKKIEHPYTKNLELFLQRKLSKITLQLTQDCNFRCKYCIYSEDHNDKQRKHSKQHMSWETAKAAIDFFHEHSIDSPDVNVGFYGGEPLLRFDMIKRLVAYCDELFVGKNLTYSITTNGTLLTKEVIEFLQEHDVMLVISLDGPKEINDKNRVFANGQGTFDHVMKNIHLLREIAPEYASKIQLSMVMDPENDFDCINTIYLDEKELASLSVLAALVDYDYDNAQTVVSSGFAQGFEYQRFLAYLSYFNRFSRKNLSPIMYSIVSASFASEKKLFCSGGLHPVDAPSGPCIPGQLRLFTDVNGRLFPCERVSETSDAMCIGTIKDGFKLDTACKLLNIGAISSAQCTHCWAFRFCTLCAKKADNNLSSLDANLKLSHCNEVTQNAIAQIRQYILGIESDMYYAHQTRKPLW